MKNKWIRFYIVGQGKFKQNFQTKRLVSNELNEFHDFFGEYIFRIF